MLSKNICAYLDMLAWSEGTSTSRWTKNDGYDVIVEGIDDSPHTFTDYSDHPNVRVTVNRKGLISTAAGRYQQLYRYWPHYRDLLDLPDFSPDSQDAVAVQLIKERQALADVEAGRIEVAINKCSNIWASLPGNDYGQRQHRTSDLVAMFKKFGGRVA